MKTAAWLFLAVVTALVAGAALWFSNQPFFLLGGSDALAIILAPSFPAQMLAAMLLGIGIASCALKTLGIWRWLRALLLLTAVCGVGCASHRLVLDGLHAELQEKYFWLTWRCLPFDPVTGPESSLQLKVDSFFLTFTHKDSNNKIRVFIGLPPWRLNTAPLADYWSERVDPSSTARRAD